MGDDHAVFARVGDARLVRVDADGEETWRATVDGTIRNYLVDRSVNVGTTEGILALDLSS